MPHANIIGDYLDNDRTKYFIDQYEKIQDRYGCKTWICGRVTMEEHFTFIDELMLEGGGFLTGSFLNEGLIDELSLVLVPIADTAKNRKSPS